MYVLEGLSQNSDINPVHTLWQDQKKTVQRLTLWNWTEFELFFKEERANILVMMWKVNGV